MWGHCGCRRSHFTETRREEMILSKMLFIFFLPYSGHFPSSRHPPNRSHTQFDRCGETVLICGYARGKEIFFFLSFAGVGNSRKAQSLTCSFQELGGVKRENSVWATTRVEEMTTTKILLLRLSRCPGVKFLLLAPPPLSSTFWQCGKTKDSSEIGFPKKSKTLVSLHINCWLCCFSKIWKI